MTGFWARQGIVPNLRWGFAALTLFMVGDGIEAGFLSPFLDERGFGAGQVSLLWGVYGFVVAVAAWLSGALAEAFGPRRVMLAGFAIWVTFEVAFLFALAQGDFTLMLAGFGVRGLGYPLFAYGFLVWVALDTPEAVMGKAVGWYWFFSMLGLGVLGSYYAGLAIPLIGEFATLASSLAFIGAGGIILVLGVRARRRERADLGASLRSMVGAFTIVARRPKVGIGGVVRIINTLGFYAFVVFLTTHMVRDVGLSTAEWQTVWGTMLLVNVLANAVFGYVADRVGRVRTVAWFGGLACAVTVPAFYYVPEWLGPNFWAVLGVAVVYGAALAGFVPLSAILPSLAPQHIGGAVAILNLGAGVSQFLGPVVAGLTGPLGIEGTIWVISGIYVAGIGLTHCLRDKQKGAADRTVPTTEGALR
ncbi:MFS transporter [Amycolatopsis thermophila]|uniref:Polyol permease family n=1 Tax=Amycolatopsis thermophila TaxID=206084 RepID=A0ABU0F1K1_9PSEU|nr:MFS transporter [Amycolatopsis thermophila]MDQ0381263.1 polyol permease family [Amycolatopsis thermophila]